uniref:Uncharacterized protein n=1 Tax=Triticum urartu TaxID=4572 RepID=A0A8R7QV95_TRIUA
REACVLQFKITMDKKHEKSMFRTELVLIGSMILAEPRGGEGAWEIKKLRHLLAVNVC